MQTTVLISDSENIILTTNRSNRKKEREKERKKERKKEGKERIYFVNPSLEIKFTQERICECVVTSAAPPREDLQVWHSW